MWFSAIDVKRSDWTYIPELSHSLIWYQTMQLNVHFAFYLLLVAIHQVAGNSHEFIFNNVWFQNPNLTSVLGNQVSVSQGNQIDTIPTWGKYFTVEADITINSYPSGRNKYNSILHFTIGKFIIQDV